MTGRYIPPADGTDFTSQCGEDRWIDANVPLPEHGIAVEVGCGEPKWLSNTYWLERRGWECYLIEADCRNIRALKRQRNATVIHAAAVRDDCRKSVKLFLAADPVLSSTRAHPRIAHARRIGIVKCGTVGTLLAPYDVSRIDFLSIDTEGTELEVLRGIRWEEMEPAVLIVEHQTCELPSNKEPLLAFFRDLRRPSYSLGLVTAMNFVFVREDAVVDSLLNRGQALRSDRTAGEEFAR